MSPSVELVSLAETVPTTVSTALSSASVNVASLATGALFRVMVRVKVLVAPAKSAAVTSNWAAPNGSETWVKLNAPLPLAVAVANTVPARRSVRLALASVVPCNVTVVLVVRLSPAVPVSEPGSSVSVGVVGGVVSMTTLSAADDVLTLPARSVAVAVMLCVPAASAVAGVMLKAPVVTSTWPILPVTRELNNWTRALASAVPAIVGVVSLVMLSVLLEPESLAASRSRPVGAVGATVSNVNDT